MPSFSCFCKCFVHLTFPGKNPRNEMTGSINSHQKNKGTKKRNGSLSPCVKLMLLLTLSVSLGSIKWEKWLCFTVDDYGTICAYIWTIGEPILYTLGNYSHPFLKPAENYIRLRYVGKALLGIIKT